MPVNEKLTRVGNLDLGQDLPFEKTTWTVQRIGWVVMVLIVAAALAGVFGKGLISRATISSQGQGLKLEYERFIRFGAPAELRIGILRRTIEHGQARILISHEYLHNMRLQAIAPEPARTESTDAGVVYSFDAPQPPELMEVVFRFEVDKIGSIRGAIGFGRGHAETQSTVDDSIAFSQFAYP